MFSRVRKRGRPPKTNCVEKSRHLNYNPFKRQKYTSENKEDLSSSHLFGSYSRSSSPAYNDNIKKNKSKSKQKIKSQYFKERNSLRNYYLEYNDDRESEYHYGSDFGEDASDKSDFNDISESDIDDSLVRDDVSDSDYSVSSYSTTSGRKSYSSARNPTPEPLWLQNRDIPILELPKSSDDLLVTKEHVMQALSVYEVLRHFRTLVRLSPFRFEEFCAVLVNEEHTYMLSEIHMMLLKAILREEDLQQTHFGALDQKDSVNSVLYFIDAFTWPEVLRSYVESDKTFDTNILQILNSCEYPFTNIENRLTILRFLTDLFLTTTPVREDLVHEGGFQYEDYCRVCHKVGDLLCCETCPAVFHLECVDPPLVDVPQGDWQCNLCKVHKLTGVTDCVPDIEKSGLLSRQEPLGVDRHGRKYWFLSRRIFVESEDGECWYYSTPTQLEELKELLDQNEFEAALCNELNEYYDEVVRQMSITEKLTNQAKGSKKSYFDVEDGIIQKSRQERKGKQPEDEGKIGAIEQKENNVDNDSANPRLNDETPDYEELIECDDNRESDGPEDYQESNEDGKRKKRSGNRDIITRSKTGSLAPRSFNIEDVERDIDDAINISETNGNRMTRLKAHQISTGTFHFKLGMDGSFKNYTNQYTSNPIALNKAQKNEERDKKRHMSYKFSVTPASEFKWPGAVYGTKNQFISTLRQALLQLENSILTPFMHVNWNQMRKAWTSAVSSSTTPRDFARTSIALQACIKPVVYASVWHDQLGHVTLSRISALEREDKKRIEKKEKKEREEEEERNRMTYNFVKYSLGLKHQVYKQKGEEYRVHGQWGWLWLSVVRKYRSIDSRKLGLLAGPDKYLVHVQDDNGEKVLMVDKLNYQLLMKKSEQEELDENEKDHTEQMIVVSDNDNASLMDISGVKVLRPITEFDEINVSKSLLSADRLHYPKVAKKSKLNDLLARRLHLKSVEERINANKKKLLDASQMISFESSKTDDEGNERSADNKDELYHLGLQIHQLKIRYTDLTQLNKMYTCYSLRCLDEKSSNCYSPLCLKLRYLRNSLLQLLHKANALSKGGKIIFFDPSNSATSADIKKEASHGATKDTDECEGNKLLNGVIKEENERIAAIKKEESESEVDEKPKNIGDYSDAVENAESETLSDMKIKLEEDSVESSLKQNLKNSAATSVGTTVAAEGVAVKAEEQINTDDNTEKQLSNGKPEGESKLPNFTLLADTSDVCNEVVIGTSEDETKCNDEEEDQEVVKEEEGEKENTEKKRLLPIKENKENTPPVVETTGSTVPSFGVNKPPSVTSSSSADGKSTSRKGNGGRSAYYSKRLSYKYPIDKLDFSFGGRSAKTSAISVNTKIPLKSEPPFVASEPDSCMYSTPDTRQRVILKKITNVLDNNKRKKRLQVKYPQSSTFSTRSKKISLLVLPQHELTKLARSAGRHYVSGFSYSAKPNYSVWHYPCPRPLFKTCWLYRTVNYRTISAAGLHLRIVWACLRWDDLQVKPSSYDCKNTYTSDTEIVTKEILDKRHTGRFSDRTEYLLRKTVVPLEQQKTIREVTPFRSGLRKRKREEALQKMEPQISEIWVDESKLELWEIRYFSEKLEKEALTGQVQSSLRPRPLTSAVNNRFESSYLTKDDSKDKSSENSTNNTSTGNRSLRYNALNKRLSSASSDNQQSPIIKSILQTSNSNEKKILINSSPMAQQVLKLFSKPAGQIITENGKVQLMKKIQISNTTNSNLKSTLTSLLGGVISSNGTSSPTTSAVVSGTNVRLPTGRKIIMAKGPDGRTRVVAAPAILPKNAQLIATKGPLSTSETNSLNNGPKLQQRIQLSKMSDGTYHVKGLLPGQQLLTYPDGKMQVLNTRQQTAPSVNMITSKSNENSNSAQVAVVKSDSSDSSTAVTADIMGAVSSANIANLRQIVPVNKLQSNPQGVVLNQQIGITSLQNSLTLPTVINNAQVLQAQPVVVNGATNNQTVVFQQQTSGSTVLHNILSGQNQQTQSTIVQSQKPSLILTSDGQLQVVSPNQIMNTQISPSPQSLVVNSSSVGSNQIVQQLISGKATLATVDGQQLIFRTIAPNSSDASSSSASTITSTNDSILLKSVNSSNLTQNSLSSSNLTQITSKTVLAPASAVTNQQPILPPQRVVSNSQNSAKSQNGLSQISGSSVSSSVNTSSASGNSNNAVINPLNGLTLEQEKEMLEKEPPGTVIKCITAQVLQSPQGPKIVLQGLHESDFSPQQLVHIRAQVKQQLLKVQADGGSEVVLGGTKIYLAVQPQDKTQSSNKETKTAHKSRMSSSRENRRQKSSRVSTSTTPVTSTLSLPALTSSSCITTPATTTITSTSTAKTDSVTSSTSNDLLSSLANNTVRNSIREEEIVSEIDQKLAAFSNYTSEIESKQDAVIKPDDSLFSPKLSLSDTLTLNSRTVSSPPTRISGKRKSKENTAEEIVAKKPKQTENAKEPETDKSDVTLKSNCVNSAESDDDKSLKELSNSSSECSLLKGFDDDDVRQSLYPLQLMDPLKKMQSKMSTELSNSYLPNRTISTKDKLQSYQAYQSNHFSSINRKSSDSKQTVAKTPSSKTSNVPTTSAAATTPAKSSHTSKSISSSRSAKLNNSTAVTSATSVTTTKSTNSSSTPANPHLTRGKRKSYSMMLSPTRNNTKPTTSSTTTVMSNSSTGRKGRRRANLSKYNSDDDETPSPAVNTRFKKEKLLCICRTPYDDTKFYVGCDLCNNWFHGECVGITEEMSKHLSEYVCTECNRARETQELYCLCRQPYDESQFYICCDRCQDWFHGRCVGILQSEADYIDEYICPNCQRNTDVNLANMKTLTARDFEDLHKLLKQIQMHKNAWPFMKPVDPVEAPDYYQVVKEPMDLSKIECRIKERKYARLSDFIGDMTKIFDNCRYYNAKDSQFFKCAESLESYFVSKVKYLRDKLNDST